MNTPFSSARPFPIPVVALGPGSQDDDEQLDYITMPQGMSTYRAPALPEPEELAGHAGAVGVLAQALERLQALLAGEPVEPVRLDGLTAADLALVNQVLGEGEVSAQLLAEPDRLEAGARVRIQESVFAGVWRVIETSEDGTVHDSIELGAVPAVLHRAAREDARPVPVPAPDAPLPQGVLNAPSILIALAEHRQHWREGRPPEVVNLTLLPVTPQDIAWLDHQLGTGRVVILSRGYGNCRITNARALNTWRVVYYNSQDTVILNSVEVCAIPEVACAAREDLEDSAERLAEVLQWVSQA